ncbi:MAG: TIGR00341 family protein [Thiotrichales bacterium]|nr:TIGR00341 family protein [Thiotrichales bacterium]
MTEEQESRLEDAQTEPKAVKCPVWLVTDQVLLTDEIKSIQAYCTEQGFPWGGVLNYHDGLSGTFQAEVLYLLHLDDSHLKSLLPKLGAVQIGLLPHPQAPLANRRFQIPAQQLAALESVLSCSTPTVIDHLYCNEQLVFSSVLIGEREVMQPAIQAKQRALWRWVYLWHLLLRMLAARLFSISLKTEKGSSLQTVALGVSVVYQPRDNLLTERLVVNEHDEPNMHLLVFSPRSISEILHFIVRRLLPLRPKSKTLESYIGYVKSQGVQLSLPKPTNVLIDGVAHELEQIAVQVLAAETLLWHPQMSQDRLKPSKEAFRVSHLPSGKLCTELLSRSLPWIYHRDSEEVKETFIALKESAQFNQAYVVLMALSSLLAAVGLYANSAPVIIGAMILAPLMAPIISLSMGLLRQERDLTFTSGRTLLYGALLALLGSMLLSWMLPLQALNSEISARLSPTLLDLAVAIISGIAGAYASAKSEVAKSLAGVAIAVALVPPLVVSGIGIGWWDWSVFSGAFLLFITNLFGIVLAAALTFLVLGFSSFHLAKRGLFASLVVVALVSIPLSFSFYSMVQEQRMLKQIQQLDVRPLGFLVEVREVKIRRGQPLEIAIELAAERPLETAQLDWIKTQLQQRLERPIVLEVSVAIRR